MKRRDFIAGAAVGTAATVLSSGKLVQAQKAPAAMKDRVEVAIVTTWPRDFPGLGTGAQRFAKRISDMSDGRIEVSYFAAGERVGAFDSFDEVASGNAQGYHAADYYWKGKHPGWAYFTSVPFGLTYTEFNGWIRFGGGQELWDELAGEFGLKGVMCGNTGVQMGGWFRKEINSADDLKGLKMRIPGLGGDVMAKLGASPVSLPGGQIYENLVSGAIDATEWVGPWNDEVMKFYEAAKYLLLSGHARARLDVVGGLQQEVLGVVVEVGPGVDRGRGRDGERRDDVRVQRQERRRAGAAAARPGRHVAQVQRRHLRLVRKGGSGSL